MKGILKRLSGFRGIAGAVAAGALVIVGVTWLLVTERARYEEEHAIEEARARSATLALAFEQQVARTLQAADQAVRFLRHEYGEEGPRLNVRRLFERNLDARQFLYGGIIDARGVLILTTGQPGADVSDREYFHYHRDYPEDRLRVSTPVTARVVGKLSLQFTRRISGPNGEFRGVAIVGAAPELLADSSRHIDVGPRGLVFLVGRDGFARARRVGDVVSADGDVRAFSLLERAAQSESGTYLSRGRLDGIQRYMSFHALQDYDLVAAVGLAADDAAAAARARGQTYYAAAAVGTVLTLLLAGMLLVALWRRNQALAERWSATARFQATFEQAAFGMTQTTLDGRFIKVNRRFAEMLGYGEDELVGRTFYDITHPDDRAQAGTSRDEILRGTRRIKVAESRKLRKDGSVVWAAVAVNAVYDAERNPVYLVAIVQDISLRKAAEQAMLDKNARLARQQQALLEAAKGEVLQPDEVEQAIRRLTEVAAETLAAERVSYWRMDEGRGAIACLDLFERTARRHAAGARLAAADYPGYFAALGRDEIIVAVDAHADSRTAEFSAGYLAPLGIGAMLDVPVFAHGRLAGVLCHEHVGGAREWQHDEQLFAASIAGLVSLALESAARRREERLARMEHGITRCLAEADDVSAGLQCTLATLCEAQGWEAARLYSVDEAADLLRCQETWSIADARYDEFNQVSRGMTFRRGAGLGGLVWQGGEAIWVPDVTRDERVTNPALARCGIRSALVFPVMSAGKAAGIVATFSREVREPDERLLRATRAIGAQIGQFVERKRAQERADHLAQYDTMTGLPNRSLFVDRLAQALSQAQRHDWNVGVLFCDVDFFKKVNETLGHANGDRLLHEIAQRLAACVRTGDTVARIGGDEFGIIAADLANPQHAALVAGKVVDALRAPFTIDGQEVFATGSVGIASYPLDGRDAVALMKNADAAMSRAKEVGRNNYQFYAATMNERALENLQLRNDLRRALEREEFRLQFQAKASLRTGRLTGFEALLRWERPGQGLVSPAKFVPVLEETGLIVPVGAWVIRAACAQLAAWRRAGYRPLPVSVNLAAKQLAQADLAASIDAALREHGVEPQLLEVEITESDAMQNPEQCIATLGRLQARGIAISIDDFGTGYSSLSYLKRMPVGTLKLDRSFVKDLPANAEDASITQAVITLAHSLELKVVAEGVETPQQRDFLAAHGCDMMQGYLLARPLPADECEALLARVPASQVA